MAPLWKVRRELTRLGQQLRAWIEPLYEPARQRRHDRAFEAGFPQFEGAREVGSRVAIVLIYQPKAIPASLLVMLDHLVSQGYAPLVISNSPLTEPARASLAPRVWRMVERPNVGYDFGGYRDGIRLLWRWSVVPDNLLILNDSIWFPMIRDADLIQRLEASSADLSGTILRDGGKGAFLESYCYHIPASTFRHPAFRAYWQGLKLTANKYKVIRRGERAHSVALTDAGLTVAPIYSNDAFRQALEGQGDDFLRTMLRHAAFTEADMGADCDAVLRAPGGPDWRALALAHVDRTLARSNFYRHYPVGAVRLLSYPILKKSRDEVARHWRSAYLGAVEVGALPAPPGPILSELRALSLPVTRPIT